MDIRQVGTRAAALAILALGPAIPAAAAAQTRAPAPLRLQPHIGLHMGAPQKVSLALGVLWPTWRAGDFTSLGGPRIVVEPGLRAGKLRAGYARTGAFAMGYALEAAVLREWGRSGAADLPSTGYGAELHGSLMFIDLGVGAYRMEHDSNKVVFSVGLVI